jgi:acetyltransferase-like isoleucine patch superfamily enzyme
MTKIKKLKTDLNGVLFSKFRSYRLKFLRILSTIINNFNLRLRKISSGKKNVFYGRTVFNRSYNSKIEIGNDCTFRSDSTSNLVGVNRKCIISTFDENAEIKIGNNCGFSGTVIGCKEKITIGDDLLAGANTLITDFDWHSVDPKLRHVSNKAKSAPVEIGNNVWLGIGVIILKGVSIGDNSVIGANSVVVKDIPSNVVASGNPCQVIKSM